MRKFALLALFALSITSVFASSANARTYTAKKQPIKTHGTFYVTTCPNPAKQPMYTGRVIVYVSKTGCASVDKGAVAMASDHAVVAAHGNSVVVARDYATVIWFNAAVRGKKIGKHVNVIWAGH